MQLQYIGIKAVNIRTSQETVYFVQVGSYEAAFSRGRDILAELGLNPSDYVIWVMQADAHL